MTLETGSTLGKYQILGRLGQGGMATVYRAFQPSLERDVALKVLRAGFAEDEEFLDRFRREARAIAHLRHANIVQVFDFEEVDGRAFMAMEFLEGGTLKERMNELAERGQRLPHDEVVRIVQQVADALAYAHRLGIVHRDVKPSNVMLLADGRAVVTDFGIAKVLSGTRHTQTGVGVGTPEYMSPEQGQGTGVDQRADIYSLGVMTYEMLTGRVPFTADTPLAIVLAHMRDPLPLPSTIEPSVGPATERVLLKALAKDPEQRYDSATAFADALRAGVAEDEAGGTMPTIIARTAATPAASGIAAATSRAVPLRRPAVIGGTAVAVVAVVVIGAVIAFARGPAASPPSPASAPASSSASAATTPSGAPGARTAIAQLEGDLLFEAKLDPTSTDATEPPAPPGIQNGTAVMKAGEADLVVAQHPPSTPEAPTLLYWRRDFPTQYVAETQLSVDAGSQIELWWILRQGQQGQDAIQLATYDETMRFIHQDYSAGPVGQQTFAPAASIQPSASGGQQYCPPTCPGPPAPGTLGQGTGPQSSFAVPMQTTIGPAVPVPGLLRGERVTIGVAARSDGHFTLFLNGAKVADITDTKLPTGPFGTGGAPLGFDAHGQGGTVRITSFRVYTLK
ncbi:MAG: protein kinase [Chloroflexota bacterium]|nr:protein kinase [Chloroflexota bacterium]MDE3102724.1 protein kinase [Chloroflexota bacterium]